MAIALQPRDVALHLPPVLLLDIGQQLGNGVLLREHDLGEGHLPVVLLLGDLRRARRGHLFHAAAHRLADGADRGRQLGAAKEPHIAGAAHGLAQRLHDVALLLHAEARLQVAQLQELLHVQWPEGRWRLLPVEHVEATKGHLAQLRVQAELADGLPTWEG